MANKFTTEGHDVKIPLDYLPKRLRNSLFLCDTNVTELMNLILVQDPKKGFSHDLISNKIIQKAQSTIAPFLVILFNNCLRRGFFPNPFKIAQVIPLLKGGERLDLN